MSIPSSFNTLPLELVDEIATLAGDGDTEFQKQLRLVNQQFSVCLAPSVFPTIHFPLSPCPSPSAIPYIESHLHIAKAVTAIVIHSVTDAVECLRFVELCDLGRSVDAMEWRLDESSERIPTSLLSILLPRRSVTLAPHHFMPSCLSWLLQHSTKLEYLHLGTATCSCKPTHEQWPVSSINPLCSLSEFVYSSLCTHPFRRIFANTVALSILHSSSAHLTILRVTVVPEDIPGIQSLVNGCRTSLELLELTLVDGRPAGFAYVALQALTIADLPCLNRLLLNSGIDGVYLLAMILHTLPVRHGLDTVHIGLTSTELTVEHWIALNRAMNRVRNFHDHEIEIFTRGSPLNTPEYFLYYAAHGGAARTLGEHKHGDDEYYALEIFVQCYYD
ncbi:hypothetical protein BDZ89DRAFT_1129842 [Hymenopellis radicata]|nr:hypothetical protein BDZ89DRAFT_1129842 [Hymenopellis radicata]